MAGAPWHSKGGSQVSHRFYILDGKTPVPATLIEWAKWLEESGSARCVRLTDIDEETHVSTVFLGLNYRYREGPPLVFETLIFGGPKDGYGDRSSTWEEAEESHKRAVALAIYGDSNG